MERKYVITFDEVMIKQLKKIAKNNQLKEILSRMLDKIEMLGPLSGNLIDPKLHIYELKNKQPPLRLYFKHNKHSDEIYVFEYEMKTSQQKQKKTIDKLKLKS